MGIHIHLPIPGFTFPDGSGRSTPSMRASRARRPSSISVRSGAFRHRELRSGHRKRRARARGMKSPHRSRCYTCTLWRPAPMWKRRRRTCNWRKRRRRTAENRKNAGTGTGIEVDPRASRSSRTNGSGCWSRENQLRQAQLQLLARNGRRACESSWNLPDPARRTAPRRRLRIVKPWKERSPRAPIGRRSRRREDGAASATAARIRAAAVGGGLRRLRLHRNRHRQRTPDAHLRRCAASAPLRWRPPGRAPLREPVAVPRQEQIRTADLKSQIELEIRLALDSLRSAEEQVKVAGEGLRWPDAKWNRRSGVTKPAWPNSIEPTDAQTRLERARDNRISALARLQHRAHQLAQAMGDIRQVIQ